MSYQCLTFRWITAVEKTSWLAPLQKYVEPRLFGRVFAENRRRAGKMREKCGYTPPQRGERSNAARFDGFFEKKYFLSAFFVGSSDFVGRYDVLRGASDFPAKMRAASAVRD